MVACLLKQRILKTFLHNRNALVTTLLDSLEEGILLFHRRRGIVAVNRQACSFLGQPAEKLYGRSNLPSLWSCIRPDGTPFAKQDFPVTLTLKTAQAQREVCMGVIRPDRQRFWLTVNTQQVMLDDELFVFVSFWDITDQFEGNLQLQQRNELFDKVFNKSSIGIAFVSLEGKWLEVNEAICTILGYSRVELLSLTFQQITFPDDLAPDLDKVNQLLAGQTEAYQLEKRYYHKNGEVIWCLLSVTLMRHADGSPKFFISRLIDITEQKNLVHTLELQNHVLEDTRRQLQTQVQRLLEFNRIVAHNLRGPVSNIKQLCDVFPEMEPDEQQELLAMLSPIADSLLETLHDVQAVINVQNHEKVAVDLCDVSVLLNRVEQQLSLQINAKKATIIHELTVPSIKYSRAYLENILYNLISNALKFTHPERESEIRVATKQVGNENVLTVSDNGLGINLELHGNELFKYKKRFHPNHEGTGVGLFLIKNQIEALGGEIRVQSIPGQGTSFYILLKI